MVSSVAGVTVTVSDVTAVTAKTVADTDIACAREEVLTYAGLLADDVVSDRDAHWLTRAVAWQAVWRAGNTADHLTRGVSGSWTQDGVGLDTGVTAGSTGAVMLAPLAQRALRNVRRYTDRTVTVGDDGSVPGVCGWVREPRV